MKYEQHFQIENVRIIKLTETSLYCANSGPMFTFARFKNSITTATLFYEN